MKYICQYCNKEFTNGGVYKKHILTCDLNPNKQKYKYDKHINNEEEITCQYCGQKFKSKSNKTQHEAICKLNPNRIARTIRQKYDMMSNEELLEEVKKYNSRKETPYQLISVCKERKIYSWEGQYVKEHFLSDEEIINELNKYNKLSEIPYGIKTECKRRNIQIPENFYIKERKNINEYTYKSDEELISIIINYKDIYEIKDAGYIEVLNELKFRKNIPEKFKGQKLNFNKYHYYTNDELLNLILPFNSISEINQNKLGAIIFELNKRKIQLPQKFIKNKVDYTIKTNEELLKIVKPYHNNKELLNAGYEKIRIELNKRGILPKRFTKNYHPEYENMTDDELIKLGKRIFNGKNIIKSIKIDRPLINHLRNRNIIYEVFPNSKPSIFKNRYKLNKIDLLTNYDLQSMDWVVILDLIGEEKLPNEFRQLCKFGANTPERKKMIEDLINTYNIDLPEDENNNEEDDDIIETEVDNIKNENDIYNEDINDEELNPMKEIQQISELLKNDDEKIFTTGDKWLHIIRKQMNKLWNLILRDNENHSTKNIEIIKSKLNDDNITKFEKYVYEEFMKEYNEVINLEIH